MEHIIVDGQEVPYQVTWDGLVWSDRSKKFLKATIRNGYEKVKVGTEGMRKDHLVHRLVATAFLPNDSPETKTQVDHIDGSRTNNEVTNLCWVTPSENTNRALKNGGKRAAKVSVKRLSTSGEVKIYESAAAAEKDGSFNRKRISACCTGRQKTHRGYHWEFLHPEKRQKMDIDLTEAKQIYDYLHYVIFKDGRVYNKKRRRFKKPVNNADYPYMSLPRKGKNKHFKLHLLVSDHFIKPREYRLENDLVVNHKDLNKHNPHVDNLELVTRRENTLHWINMQTHD